MEQSIVSFILEFLAHLKLKSIFLFLLEFMFQDQPKVFLNLYIIHKIDLT